jgi:ectoine hydroxylase
MLDKVTHRLTADEKAALARDGFVLRHDVFDAADRAVIAQQCEEMVTTLEQAKRNEKREMGSYLFEAQRDYRTLVKWEPEFPDVVMGVEPFAHFAPELRDWGLDARLADPARDMIGEDEVILYTEKLNVKRAHRGGPIILHQDYPYWERSSPVAARIVTAMIFLDDADLENGCLEVAPGSHTVGKHKQWDRDDGKGLEIDTDAFDLGRLQPLQVKAGAVVWFGAFLVHRSLPNRSDRDRRALLYSYQPAGNPTALELSRFVGARA